MIQSSNRWFSSPEMIKNNNAPRETGRQTKKTNINLQHREKLTYSTYFQAPVPRRELGRSRTGLPHLLLRLPVGCVQIAGVELNDGANQ